MQIAGKRRLKRLVAVPLCGAALIVAAPQPATVKAFTARNLMQGSTGYDVDELQNRLAFLGYYHGKVDGIFGWDTYWAVRDFQYAFGMKVTGYVNMATKIMLVKATSAWHYTGPIGGSGSASTGGSPAPAAAGGSPHPGGGSPAPAAAGGGGSPHSGGGSPAPAAAGGGSSPTGNALGAGGSAPTGNASWAGGAAATASSAAAGPSSLTGPMQVSGTSVTLSSSDLSLMAHVVYAEARNQPFSGQVGVAAVIINRLKSGKFPNSVSGIVYAPGAFQSVSNGTVNLTPNATAWRAVADAVQGWDPVGPALYYFNPATSTSGWIWSRHEVTQIGQQIFST